VLDLSGYSFDMSAAGDRVAIGAPYNHEGIDGNGPESGHVRIYDWDGSTQETLMSTTTTTTTMTVISSCRTGSVVVDVGRK
jgi:hypothetical protein